MAKIATLADIEAFEAIPLEERNLPPNTLAALERAAAQYPDETALHFFLQGTAYQDSISFTYSEFVGKIRQAANMFHDLGVGPTDTVSFILPNLPQTYFTLWGGEAAGIANPINPLLEADTIAEIMRAAEAKVLVTIAPFPNTDIWEKVVQIADDVPTLKHILQVDIAGYLSGFKKVMVNLMRLGKNKKPTQAQVLDFDKRMAAYPTDRLVSGREIKSDEIAAYFHTGGTTGTPKLARHTHGNEVFDAWMVGSVSDGQPGEGNLLGLPLFHNYGAIAIGLSTWMVGAFLVMATPSGFRGEGVVANLWHIVAHYRCALLSAVPTLFTALLEVPVGDADLSSLRGATCGAAPLPVEVARQFEQKTGIKIVEGYGLTEATSVSSVNPFRGEPRIGSIGFRLPYQEMRTAELDDAGFVRFCDTNEVGIVLVRGPNVFAGYSDDFHNQGAFIDAGDGGGPWLNSGDLGRMDEDGFFWLTGRKKELIIRGGHNIDPKQIEEPMHEHPAVALAAAVGRPDPRVGELPVAYVELKPGAQADEAELLAFARDHIGEQAAVPKRIHIIDKMPVTAVGKIYKPTLIHEQVISVFKEELAAMDGVLNHSMYAENDKRLGVVVYLQVQLASGSDKAAMEQKIRDVLGQYAVHLNLKLS